MTEILAVFLTVVAVWGVSFSSLSFGVRILLIVSVVSAYRMIWG